MMKKFLTISFLIWFVISSFILIYVQILDFRVIAIGEIQSYEVKSDKAFVVINKRLEMVKQGYYNSSDDVVIGSRAIVYSFEEDFYLNKHNDDDNNIVMVFALKKVINFSKFYAVLILFLLFSNFMKRKYKPEIY